MIKQTKFNLFFYLYLVIETEIIANTKRKDSRGETMALYLNPFIELKIYVRGKKEKVIAEYKTQIEYLNNHPKWNATWHP